MNKLLISVLYSCCLPSATWALGTVHTVKVTSERLLAVAKRAVKMTIEHDEATAMNYLAANSSTAFSTGEP